MVKHWYDNTVYSRLDDKSRDVIILIMQRLRVDDLVAHVMRTGDWVVLSLPAIAEVEERIDIGPDRYFVRRIGLLLHAERESAETLAKVKDAIGSYNIASQYQQEP